MKRFSEFLFTIPVINFIARKLIKFVTAITFHDSIDYWENRYRLKLSSGSGSYGQLAEFKAEVINNFLAEQKISSIIEFGCGDGNQLSLAQYPKYIGLDVSKTAIKLCIGRFANDFTKSFFIYDPKCFVDMGGIFQCDLALSLDVIFHLVEDSIFQSYLKHLFSSAKRFVVIYSNDFDEPQTDAHIKSRCFTKWINENIPHWTLIRTIQNRYPFNEQTREGSWSEFFIYGRKDQL
jgi:SAM-dependent methyltransferase